MELSADINAIAKAAVMTDAGNLQGLVQLQEQFQAMGKQLDAEFDSLAAASVKAAQCVSPVTGLATW